MGNAYTDFKNRYAGKKTVADKLTEEAVRQIKQAYVNAYNAIFKEIIAAKKEIDYPTFAKQTQLLRQIGEKLDILNKAGGATLKITLREIAKYATSVAIKDLEALGSGLTKAESWHYKYNQKYVVQVFKDTFGHVAAQTDKMVESAKVMLRKEAAEVFRRAAVEGVSRKEAYKELKGKLLERDPSFVFIDKKGREWKTESYLEMLTRTVMATTMSECYTNTLTNEGQDLVKVSSHGATDVCRKWEGKVISLTGATPGYPTLAELQASRDIFHPRCRHRLLAYHKSMDDVFKAVEEGKSDGR